MNKRHLLLLEPGAGLERRHFLVGCAAAFGGAACSGTTSPSTGGGGSNDDAGSGDDASSGDDSSAGDDSGMGDDSSMSNCPASAKDTTRAPGDIQMGKPYYVPAKVAFVVRDPMGLYALTAVCTHQGCTVTAQGATGFYCMCHGASFDENGTATGG